MNISRERPQRYATKSSLGTATGCIRPAIAAARRAMSARYRTARATRLSSRSVGDLDHPHTIPAEPSSSALASKLADERLSPPRAEGRDGRVRRMNGEPHITTSTVATRSNGATPSAPSSSSTTSAPTAATCRARCPPPPRHRPADWSTSPASTFCRPAACRSSPATSPSKRRSRRPTGSSSWRSPPARRSPGSAVASRPSCCATSCQP